MYFLYNTVLFFTAPIWYAWMMIRVARRKDKPNRDERFGNYSLTPSKTETRIWIHAVSVGEVMASLPILREIRAIMPEAVVVLSVTTSSGHKTAADQAEGLFNHLVYFPIDLARSQLAAMQRVQPKAIAIMETELWYNFLWAAKIFDARVLLVNGRISDRSFPRAKWVSFFYRELLKNVDRCLMQTETDRERIQALGAKEAEVFGNVKFDQALEGLAADPEEWRTKLRLPDGLPVIVIGSTRGEEEEQLVIRAIKEVGPQRVCVIHAPRHLERVEELKKAVEASVGPAALRSKGETGTYIILDTYGELSQVYALADIAIVGGGFAPLGGQNVIQPLALGKPVLHGPHMENFREAATAAHTAGAAKVCSNSAELRDAIDELLESEGLRLQMGNAARALVAKSSGAARRYAEAIVAAAKGID